MKGTLKLLFALLSLGLTGAFTVGPARLPVRASPAVASAPPARISGPPQLLGKGAAKAKRIQQKKQEQEGDGNTGLALIVFGGSIVAFVPFVLLGIAGQAAVEAGNTAAGEASIMFFNML